MYSVNSFYSGNQAFALEKPEVRDKLVSLGFNSNSVGSGFSRVHRTVVKRDEKHAKTPARVLLSL